MCSNSILGMKSSTASLTEETKPLLDENKYFVSSKRDQENGMMSTVKFKRPGLPFLGPVDEASVELTLRRCQARSLIIVVKNKTKN